MSSSCLTACECLCVERRRLESQLPFKRTTILVGYLVSMMLGSLALVMFSVSLYLEDRPDFYSALSSWGIDSKHLAYILFLFSLVTAFIDKLQQFWVELEVSSKSHLFGIKSTAFNRNVALVQSYNV
ncbi:hypothetical protein BIW11_05388 [Tropilaelaps mercedesae]|uniref:Uncharacterized protein n=1 Tax=Tropilaelaps mercedesae TaxID=418985 RepID=A0A1V9Y2W7_9ACAR|nr:hypothetical protein BIW11_05388 [Tropilaelaps mercedesae]